MVKKLCLLVIIGVAILTTGCKIQIFEEEVSPYTIQDVSVNELKQDTFYIKNGTKFNEVVVPERNFSSEATSIDNKRMLWTFGDEESIPTLYKNEVIAYASSSTNRINGVSLERFKDMGYSFGFYNGGFDAEGSFCFYGNNTVAQSNANSKFGQSNKYIRITSINDIPVSSEMINAAGSIVGLDKFGKYKIGYFSGTYYEEEEWIANSHVFQAFECFTTTNVTQTKNGYIQIEIPEDLKSGYYLINGAGLFKYIAQNKGEVSDVSSIDMNEPYRQKSEKTDKEKTVQEFAVFINDKKTNMTFSVTYEQKGAVPEAVLISPNGQEYIMEDITSSGTLTCSLTEVMQGEWAINVSPATVVVTDISCKKNIFNTGEQTEELSEEIVEVELSEGATNRLLKVDYAGVTPESAVVITPDGKSYRLTIIDDNVLGYNFTYAREGIYEIHVYYKEDFLLKDAYMYDNSKYETEIITVID